MTRRHVTDRVYLNPEHRFYDQLRRIDLQRLISDVAYAVRVDEYGNPLVIDSKICEGKTKSFIARQANQFIVGLAVARGNQNMASYASKTQIDNLLKPKKGHQKITCYAHVIINVMYRLILEYSEDETISSINMREYCHYIQEIAREYFGEVNEEEREIALYLLESYDAVNNALSNHRAACSEELPPILKRNPSPIPNDE